MIFLNICACLILISFFLRTNENVYFFVYQAPQIPILLSVCVYVCVFLHVNIPTCVLPVCGWVVLTLIL